MWENDGTGSSTDANPKFNLCCRDGAVKLPPNRDPPPRMREMWTSNRDYAVQFRQHSRRYNTAFAFTSAYYQKDEHFGGYKPFQIQGELYHLHGPIGERTRGGSRNAQVYIHDPEYGTNVRCGTTKTSTLPPWGS